MSDQVVAFLESAGLPVTRQTYIEVNWWGAIPDPWTPEDEADLPEDLQDWDVFEAADGGASVVAKKGIAQDDWKESEHPRGQPENAGEFGPGGGGSKAAKPKEASPEAPPKRGEPFMVYRAGHAGSTLSGRNAGNAHAVASHIQRLEDNEAPSFGAGGLPDTVKAYEVMVDHDFGPYHGLVGAARGGDPAQEEDRPVGMSHEGAAIQFSFGKNGYTAREVASLPLDAIRDELERANPMPGRWEGAARNFDEQGSLNGAAAIRAAFEKHLAGDKPAKATHPDVVKTLGEEGVAKVRGLIADHASSAAILAALEPAAGEARGQTPTCCKATKVATQALLRTRTYTTGGLTETVKHLVSSAKDFAGPGGVKNDKKVVFVTGPPAAGKSTIAEIIAHRLNAAILDPDEAKKVIPEFRGGIGAPAVHEESSEITAIVGKRLTDEGANIVYPMIGDDPAKIAKKAKAYADKGYSVALVNLDVSADNAAARMAGRYLGSNRLIDPGFFASVTGGQSQAAYQALREDPLFKDGAAQVDGDAALGQETIKDVVGAPLGYRKGQLASA